MKFNVQGKALQQQMAAVSKVINTKNSMSILDNFLLRVEGDMLYITGSDQENVMTASLEVMESDGNGSIAVPAKRLLDMLKEVTNQALSFYINDETKEIDIRFLNGHFNFMGIDSKEYPQENFSDEDAQVITVPADLVRKGIESTLFAASVDTIRPIMTGLLWDVHPDNITFVASDTHKLVRYINSEAAPGIEKQFIMPAKPASILKGVISKEDADIKITLTSKSARFEFGNYVLSCRYINGVYPNYNRVIPENNPFELTIDRTSLLLAMRRVALSASMASSLVRFNIQPNELLLSAQDLDYSTSAEERLMCDYEGNTMTIGFNATYMIEVLSNLKGDTITISLSDPSRPGLFMPQLQQEGENMVMLLMPMQVMDY